MTIVVVIAAAAVVEESSKNDTVIGCDEGSDVSVSLPDVRNNTKNVVGLV